MNENRIKDYKCDWSSEEGQKIIEEVNNRIRGSKSKGQLVDDKRYEKLKERMKKLLLEKKPSSLINEENKNKKKYRNDNQ